MINNLVELSNTQTGRIDQQRRVSKIQSLNYLKSTAQRCNNYSK